MKSTRNKLLMIGLLAAVLVCLSLGRASAYTIIGSWLDSNIPPEMSVNQNGTNDCSGEFKALYRSGTTWGNEAGSYFYFDRRVPTFNTEHAGYDDGYNQISWDPAPINDYIAITYNYGWLHINETDISMNSNYSWNCLGTPSWNEMDVQNIATHELGHSLGLGHSSYTEATMYAYANNGETKKRSLHWDDIDGLEYLYPARRVVEKDFPQDAVDQDLFSLSQPVKGESGLIEIRFSAPMNEDDVVSGELKIYDAKGEIVRTLFEGTVPGGENVILWDGRNDAGELLSPSVYFLTYDTGRNYASEKLLPDLFLR